jgi:hypothetical protein
VRYIYAVVAGGRRQPCPAVPLADANGQRDDSTVEHLHVHGDEHLQYRDKQVFEGGRQRIAKRLVNRITSSDMLGRSTTMVSYCWRRPGGVSRSSSASAADIPSPRPKAAPSSPSSAGSRSSLEDKNDFDLGLNREGREVGDHQDAGAKEFGLVWVQPSRARSTRVPSPFNWEHEAAHQQRGWNHSPQEGRRRRGTLHLLSLG